MNEPNLTSLLEAMFHHSKEMIIFVNKSGEIVHMNAHAASTLDETDYDRSQFQHICNHCQGMYMSGGRVACSNCYLYQDEIVSFQVYMRTREGEVVPFIANFQRVDPENEISVFTLNPLAEQLKTQEIEHQKRLTQRIIQAQEGERKRISRDLHDGVTQELLNVLLEMRLLKYVDDREALNDKMVKSEESLSHLLDYVRNISVELRPASLDDLGIEAALKTHFKWIERQYGISVDFSFTVEQKRFNPEVETVLYRIIQEAIFNAAKYAEVDCVDVSLEEMKNEETHHIKFTIEDAGLGFHVGDTPVGTGLGLFGMSERASSVGGTVSVDSAPGRGTKVFGSIPV
ncbi:sensor histidine kinase [Salinicoccus hispanicus]|uniref:Sensor histidine kinase n=1 Tax=Salinicoccus hispanicus TaxID=157225 RepID=A0A6N8U3A5_9STAP|nr:sensor histidine kinase [Salinicoccus hispanicus]MXQ50681.1 two-component sensor histidine kinase [Salinicoccus hispanicus]